MRLERGARGVLTSVSLAALLACESRGERGPDAEKVLAAAAQPPPPRAAEAPAPAADRPPAKGAPERKAPAARDITVPPPDVDVHVINGRNILSAPLDAPAAREPDPASGGDSPARVRVTFWTTPEGQILPAPQQFEGALADLDLGIGDLPMLSPGQKRRLWIPGPTGMATLDVELLSGAGNKPAKTTRR